MRFAKTLMGVAAALFIGGAASAATVKVTFGGTFVELSGFGSTPIKLGQKISITHFVDPDAQPIATSQTSTEFSFLGTELTVPDQGQTVLIGTAPGLNPGFNKLSAFGAHYQIESSDLFGVLAASIIDFPKGQIIDGSSLAPFIDQLQSDGFAGLSQSSPSLLVASFEGVGWWGDCSSASFGCNAWAFVDSVNVSQIQAVPVPAAFPLMVLGLAGLGFAGRRRGRID